MRVCCVCMHAQNKMQDYTLYTTVYIIYMYIQNYSNSSNCVIYIN